MADLSAFAAGQLPGRSLTSPSDLPSPQTTSSSPASCAASISNGIAKGVSAAGATRSRPPIGHVELPSPFVLQPILANASAAGDGPPTPLFISSYAAHPMSSAVDGKLESPGGESLVSPIHAASTSPMNRIPSIVFNVIEPPSPYMRSTAATPRIPAMLPVVPPTPLDPDPAFSSMTSPQSHIPVRRKGSRGHNPSAFLHSSVNWRRRHAWNWPWDVYLVLNYFITLLLLATFPLAVYILPDPLEVYAAQVAPFMVLLLLATLIGIYVSAKETESQEVRNTGIPRNMQYEMQRGIRVVDRSTGNCAVCRVHVDADTFHCKRCNKCIASHDHHCRWLNTCIAGANRTAFNLMLTAMVLAGAIYVAVMFRLLAYLFASGARGKAVEQLAWDLTAKFSGLPATNATVQGVRAAVVFLLAIGLICFSGVVQLSTLHMRLYWRGITTTDYLRERRRNRREAARKKSDAAKASLDAGLSSATSDATRVQPPFLNTSKVQEDILPRKPSTTVPAHGSITRGGGVSSNSSVPDATNVVRSTDGLSSSGQVIVSHADAIPNQSDSDDTNALWESMSDLENERGVRGSKCGRSICPV